MANTLFHPQRQRGSRAHILTTLPHRRSYRTIKFAHMTSYLKSINTRSTCPSMQFDLDTRFDRWPIGPERAHTHSGWIWRDLSKIWPLNGSLEFFVFVWLIQSIIASLSHSVIHDNSSADVVCLSDYAEEYDFWYPYTNVSGSWRDDSKTQD